jgi:hypothetical protein
LNSRLAWRLWPNPILNGIVGDKDKDKEETETETETAEAKG